MAAGYAGVCAPGQGGTQACDDLSARHIRRFAKSPHFTHILTGSVSYPCGQQTSSGGRHVTNYDIYMLGEQHISVSGGGQLDGVNQGDGHHLVGRTLTLNAPEWQPVSISDNNANFEDNGNQTLNGAQTIDGVSYASGTKVEAEYGLVVSDGTNTWTLVGFNVNNSNPNFGTVEGLAFVGGPGEFPPVGVPLTVVSAFEGPSYAATSYATPICLVSGTMVETPDGPRPVEAIRPGDKVLTRDGGAQEVRWVGARDVMGMAGFAPVRFAPGVLGNDAPLWVSQQHRVLVEDWRLDLLVGAPEALVAAVHLVNGRDVQLVAGGIVTYVHLLFDTHQVIRCNGCWTESLYPGDSALGSMPRASRAEVLALFPELAGTTRSYGPPCHPVLRRHEAALLAA
jgi:hypothetical protein